MRLPLVLEIADQKEWIENRASTNKTRPTHPASLGYPLSVIGKELDSHSINIILCGIFEVRVQVLRGD